MLSTLGLLVEPLRVGGPIPTSPCRPHFALWWRCEGLLHFVVLSRRCSGILWDLSGIEVRRLRVWIRGRDDDCPTFGTIPPRALVCLQWEGGGRYSGCLHREVLEEGHDVVEIGCNGVRLPDCHGFSVFLIYISFILLRLIIVFFLALWWLSDGFWSALRYHGSEGLEQSRCWGLAVQGDRLHEEWLEEDSVQLFPITQLLWECKVAYGGAKEDLRDQEADLLARTGEGALGVDGDHRWGFQGFREGKGSYGLPKGFLPNGRVTKGDLNISHLDALGE